MIEQLLLQFLALREHRRVVLQAIGEVDGTGLDGVADLVVGVGVAVGVFEGNGVEVGVGVLVGRGVGVDLAARGFEHRAQEGDGGALAVGAGDVDDRGQAAVRRAQPFEQGCDPLEREVDQLWVELLEKLQEFGARRSRRWCGEAVTCLAVFVSLHFRVPRQTLSMSGAGPRLAGRRSCLQRAIATGKASSREVDTPHLLRCPVGLLDV